MKILIDFEDEAIWEAADDNQITLNLLEKRLTKFCNSTTVKRILLEGVILDPLLSKKELN
jgi:hypothetical protein